MRRHRVVAAAVFFALLIVVGPIAAGAATPGAATWSMPAANPGRTLFNAAERTLRPTGWRVLWQAANGSGAIVVADGRVFTVLKGPHHLIQIAALNARTGTIARIYARGTLNLPVRNALAYAAGRLYLALDELRAWNVQTGKQVLTTSISAGVPSLMGAPIISGNTVYTLRDYGRRSLRAALYAIDARNGRVLWRRSVPGEQEIGQASVCAGSGAIYVIQGGPAAYAVAYTLRGGRLLWRWRLGGIRSGHTSCVAAYDRVFGVWPGTRGRIAAGLSRAGRLRWLQVNVVVRGAAYGLLYGMRSQPDGRLSGVMAVNPANGRAVWTNQTFWDASLHAIANHVLYMSNKQGAAAGLGAGRGQILGWAPLPRGYHVTEDFAIGAGMLVLRATRGGRSYLIAIGNGKHG